MTGQKSLCDAARTRANDIESVRQRGNYAYGGEGDVRILRGLVSLVEKAEKFGEMVLECDNYGCQNGPDKCLHADAARFLRELRGE